LGAGQIESAKKFYATFKVGAAVLIALAIVLTFSFQVQLVDVYTNLPSVRQECLTAFPFLLINTFPDLFKGMLKGIIKAMGIQHKAVYVHLVCHWMILPTSFYLLAFKFELGIAGLWLSKIILEFCIVILYGFIISTSSWELAS
jgi:Na+-driven multidrug efflux pump